YWNSRHRSLAKFI
ncbi:hypothetical protein AB1N83_009639, partial [Pleurotus pulmonarius]